MARGLYSEPLLNGRGEPLGPGKTVTICQPGTTTPVTDHVYSAKTSGTDYGAGGPVPIGSDGMVTFYYDSGGTYLPGQVTLYRTATGGVSTTSDPDINKTVTAPSDPLDTPATGIAASEFTAKGDLLAGTANGAFDNLAYSAHNYDVLGVSTGASTGFAYLPAPRSVADFFVFWDASQSKYIAAGPGQTTITGTSTDVGAVINSAVTALAGAGTIQILPSAAKRVYDSTSEIAINQNGICLRGAGGVHRGTIPSGPVVIRLNSAQTSLVNATGFYFHMDNLILDGNGLCTNTLLMAQQSQKVTQCTIVNGTTYNVRGTALGGTIINCNLQGPDPDSSATPDGNLRIDSTDWMVAYNRINRGGGGAGIGVVFLNGAANQFVGNHVTGVVTGGIVGAASKSLLYTGATRQKIQGNFFDSCDGTAMVTLANSDCQFEGNLLYQSAGVAANNTVPAIDATSATSTTLRVSGNHFVAGAGRVWTYAISCTGGGAATSGDFTGNMVSNCTALYDTKPGILGYNMYAGKPTRIAGTAAFSAATTKTVTHGCAVTPTKVMVTSYDQATGVLSVDAASITSTQFTVTAESSNSKTFYWEAWA